MNLKILREEVSALISDIPVHGGSPRDWLRAQVTEVQDRLLQMKIELSLVRVARNKPELAAYKRTLCRYATMARPYSAAKGSLCEFLHEYGSTVTALQSPSLLSELGDMMFGDPDDRRADRRILSTHRRLKDKVDRLQSRIAEVEQELDLIADRVKARSADERKKSRKTPNKAPEPTTMAHLER